MIEKIKVVSADIIVTGLKYNPDKPYYEIKYQEVGSDDYNIVFGSYDLAFVAELLETYFEKANDNCVPKCDYEQLYTDSIKLINQLQQENQELKAKVEQVANVKVNSLYDKANKMLDMNKILEELKNQKEILDYLKENSNVEKYEGNFNTPSELYLKISLSEADGDRFNKTKEWLDNDN